MMTSTQSFDFEEQPGLFTTVPAPALNIDLAEQISEACKAGDLVKAYGIVARQRNLQVVNEAMLKAGFSVIGQSDPQFLSFVQQTLAKAARAKTDGWGMRSTESIF